jgi:hypothetical protein
LLESGTRDVVITGNEISGHSNPGGYGIRGRGKDLEGILVSGDNSFGDNGTNVAGVPVPRVEAAGYLNLPGGDVIRVHGGTDVESIAPEPGRQVTLVFEDSLVVHRGTGNLYLTRNLTADRNDALTLVSDGKSWFEVSRIDP